MKKMKLPAYLILVLLTLCISFTAFAQAESTEITEKTFPLYVGNTDSYLEDPFPLYFIDDVTDLPFIDLEDWCELANLLFPEIWQDEAFKLTYKTSGNTVQLIRENGYSATIDYDKGTITFDDYNGFIHTSKTNSSLIDMLSIGAASEDTPVLFQRLPEMYFDRYGDVTVLDLTAYNIPMVMTDKQFFLPLQTVGDFMLSVPLLENTLFNGSAIFIATGDEMIGEDGDLTPLGELYYSAPEGNRSEALADFGYNELCLALDSLYGLKSSHDITSFAQLFYQIGFDEPLCSLDPVDADLALYNFIDFYLDDLHSNFNGYSYLSGQRENDGGFGAASRKYDAAAEEYATARSEANPDGTAGYEEVGNTAYITFDTFEASIDDYYTHCAEDGYEVVDTFTQIINAHSMIFRDDSPVENVVLDLSNNSGGAVDAAIFVLSWYLGETPYSIKDMFTGAQSTAIYRADVNLDHQFDENDTLAGKNLYCLISPVSFSCGNLVPAILKSSQKVTLIGRTSGGGSCSVQPMTTAWGTLFQISSPNRLSFTKNGSFYDIDQGVDPNYYINNISNFYDREALTNFINSLF